MGFQRQKGPQGTASTSAFQALLQTGKLRPGASFIYSVFDLSIYHSADTHLLSAYCMPGTGMQGKQGPQLEKQALEAGSSQPR